jgi:RNA polymerase sigma-70 factor (ECF subfamily)
VLDRHAFLTAHRGLLDRLFARSGARRWAVTQEEFDRALFESSARRFNDRAASHGEIATYLESLHLEDLALATACRSGSSEAWDHFIAEFRPLLYAAARAIRPGDHRELADSLYAELYGLVEREGQRRSLMAYFHGRSSLATWLRSVLAQRHVDRVRATAREKPLEELPPGSPHLARSADPPDPHYGRYVALARQAVRAAIGALSDADRLRLASYYVQGLTLAEIGRITGEHESTISRKLDRSRREIRKSVERTLQRDHQLTEAEIRRCYEAILEDGRIDTIALLEGRSGGSAGASPQAAE